MAFGLRRRKLPAAEVDARVRETAATAGPRALPRSAAARAVGRRAPARGARARDGARAAGVPVRRAALEPRRASCASRCAPRSSGCTSACARTMIYVTHDQVEAMTLGDRIAVLQRRRAAAGRRSVHALRAAGELSSSRSFIGSPPINLFPAVVRSLQGTATVLEIPGVQLPLSPALERARPRPRRPHGAGRHPARGVAARAGRRGRDAAGKGRGPRTARQRGAGALEHARRHRDLARAGTARHRSSASSCRCTSRSRASTCSTRIPRPPWTGRRARDGARATRAPESML